MTALKEFTISNARSLPVILLADVSGSMSAEGKIEALNQSVRDMLAAFSSNDDLRAEIHIAIITFGGQARVHIPLQRAGDVKWMDMVADGKTPLGSAMSMAADLIEDQAKITNRAYRPTVILVSDGQPTDQWHEALDRLAKQGRAQKADRIALAIGGDADLDMLRRFLSDERKQVFVASDARRIKDFFQFVTMSVAVRSRSVNPNDVPVMQNPFDLDRV